LYDIFIFGRSVCYYLSGAPDDLQSAFKKPLVYNQINYHPLLLDYKLWGNTLLNNNKANTCPALRTNRYLIF